jgi:transposase
MRSLSYNLQQNIISLLRQAYTTRQVAEKCNVSQPTVCRMRKKHLPNIKLSRGGHPKKLSPQDKRSCVRAVTSGQLDTAVAAAKRLRDESGVEVSNLTVRRALQEAGLKAQEKEAKPKLSARNIKTRLEFARRHRHWTVEDWKRVIWSDETKINRFCSDGRSWCWARGGESRQPHHVKQTVKHGGGSLMVWGCMTAHGPGFMCKLEGTMDQHLYKQILEEDLYGTIEEYEMDVTRVIFQHDNDPKHKAKSVQKWLEEQPLEVLEWPAQSPDLNPIEHLWALLKRRLNQYETPPSGMLELWERTHFQFYKITGDECMRLYDSMPRRIEAVLAAKGMWTDY